MESQLLPQHDHNFTYNILTERCLVLYVNQRNRYQVGKSLRMWIVPRRPQHLIKAFHHIAFRESLRPHKVDMAL